MHPDNERLILQTLADSSKPVQQNSLSKLLAKPAQSILDTLHLLRLRGLVNKPGGDNYEITEKGLDWLLEQT